MARTPAKKAPRKAAAKVAPVKVATSAKPTFKARLSRLKNKSFGQSRAYLFEYGLMLLLVGGLVSLLAYMTDALVSYVGNDTSVPLGSLDYEFSIMVVSSTIVIAPLLAIVLRRTRETEYNNPLIKNTGWRKAFLGIFLATLSVTTIALAIQTVNEVVSYVAHLDTHADHGFAWSGFTSSLATFIIFASTVWLFGQDYRAADLGKYGRWQYLYRYALLAAVIILTVLFVVFPMREERNNYKDARKNGDSFVNEFGSCKAPDMPGRNHGNYEGGSLDMMQGPSYLQGLDQSLEVQPLQY